MALNHILTQDVPATVIPAGDLVTLSKGTEVFITQSLGGNVTVRTDLGLLRIAREHTGALEGYVPESVTGGEAIAGEFNEQAVWDALKTCFDPEIPVNIVDLGLIYSVNEEDRKVAVEMTLTSPACPAGPQIVQQAKMALERLEDVDEATITITLSPPWTPDRMTDDAKDMLGIF